MRTGKMLLTGVLATLAMPSVVLAWCVQQTNITNVASSTLRIVEFKSSSSPPFFDSQWTGLLAIPAGQTRTIFWVSDLDCNDALGVPNEWDVKLFRSNGATHYCARLTPSQAVTIDTPGLCL
jgi:hypothetical protein